MLTFNLSLRTYFYINKSQSVFDNTKKVIIIRETGDEYGLKGLRVLTRDTHSIHSVLKTIIDQNVTKESLTPFNIMTSDSNTMGLIIALVASICFSFFLLFLILLHKYGQNAPSPMLEEKCEQSSKTLPKLIISGPISYVETHQQEEKEPPTPDLEFDEESDSENFRATAPNEDQILKKEISNFSTMKNLSVCGFKWNTLDQ